MELQIASFKIFEQNQSWESPHTQIMFQTESEGASTSCRSPVPCSACALVNPLLHLNLIVSQVTRSDLKVSPRIAKCFHQLPICSLHLKQFKNMCLPSLYLFTLFQHQSRSFQNSFRIKPQVRQIDVWDVSVKELSYDTFERIYSRYLCGLPFLHTRNKM